MAQKRMLTRALQEQLLGHVSFSAVTDLLAKGADPCAGFDRRMRRNLSESGIKFSLDFFELQDASGAISKSTSKIVEAAPLNFIGGLLGHPERSSRQSTLSAWMVAATSSAPTYRDATPVLTIGADDLSQAHPLFVQEHRAQEGAFTLDWHTVAILTRNRSSTACLFSAMEHSQDAAERVGARCMSSIERSLKHKRDYDEAPWAMEVGAGRYAHPHSNEPVDTLRALAWGARIPLSFWKKEVEMKFLMPGYAEHRVTPISHAFTIGGNQCGIHHAAAHSWYAPAIAEAAKALRDGGLNIYDMIEKTGKSMLHMAAEHGRADLISRLLELGFDPTLKDSRGWTATSYAKSSNSPDSQETLALLQASSARSVIATISARARLGLLPSP